MSFIEEIVNRGFLYQCTNIEKLKNLDEKIVAYVGFDCTANSLHIGNLLTLMLMRLFQKYGHQVIIIIGGATSKIGDPSFKDKARPVLSDEEISWNIQGIKHSISKFLDIKKVIMLNNADWLYKYNYIDVLKEFGSYFSVNRMLTQESVKLRLGKKHHFSFLEFNYMLLQAIDFHYLHKNYNCNIQIGGSDQWGNIIMGVDLIHKICSKEVFGLTIPLITTASGAKMGKTAQGAVWLNEDLLPPYDYFQYWRNIDDKDLLKFAKLYSDLEDSKIEELSKKNINDAKKELAFILTELCHGKEKAQNAKETAKAIFEKNDVSLSSSLLPSIDIKMDNLKDGILLSDILVISKVVTSKSSARKLILGNGVKINDIKISDQYFKITKDHLPIKENYIKLTVGKKNNILIKPSV